MNMLIAGVLIWAVVHLMKSVAPGLRASIQGAIGEGPHKGLVALSLVGAILLMVFEIRKGTRWKL